MSFISITKCIILGLALFFLVIPPVSAFAVDGVSAYSGTMSFTFHSIAPGEVTFPSDHSLVLTTDLGDPQWSIIASCDGLANPVLQQYGKKQIWNTFILSCPNHEQVKIDATITGTLPYNGKNYVTVQELDKTENIVQSYSYPIAAAETPVPTIPSATIPAGTTAVTTSPAAISPATTTPAHAVMTPRTPAGTSGSTKSPRNAGGSPTPMYTPWSDTPAPTESPLGIEIAVLGIGLAGIILVRRR